MMEEKVKSAGVEEALCKHLGINDRGEIEEG